MDPSASSGLNMTVVGVTTVFLALTLLLAVVTIMAKLVGGETATASPGAKAASASGAAPIPAGGSPAVERDELSRVALAAYALHQARRVSVRGPAPASPWLRAGRQNQVDRMR